MSESFGTYELERKIAQGGMADIFLARRTGDVGGFEKRMVLKRIFRHLTEREETVRMFIDEARIASKLNHPNIVEVYDLGEIGGYFYTTMEFVHGTDLRQICRRGLKRENYLPARLAAHIVATAAEALHYAHTSEDEEGRPRNIVHRDVSPQNVLVSREGYVKLCDFGIAKAENRLAQTRTGQFKGKLSYMSPEQVEGESVDARSDVFNLGIVLYEVTLARRLFDAESDVERMRQVSEVRFDRPSDVHPDFPPQLERIILRALRRDPDDRYQSAEEMRRELEQWLHAGDRIVSRTRVADYVRELFPEFEDDIAAALSELNGIEDPNDFDTGGFGVTTEVPLGGEPDSEMEAPPTNEVILSDYRSASEYLEEDDQPRDDLREDLEETTDVEETQVRYRSPASGSVEIDPSAGSATGEGSGEWQELPETAAASDATVESMAGEDTPGGSGAGGEGLGRSRESLFGARDEEGDGSEPSSQSVGEPVDDPAATPSESADDPAQSDADDDSGADIRREGSEGREQGEADSEVKSTGESGDESEPTRGLEPPEPAARSESVDREPETSTAEGATGDGDEPGAEASEAGDGPERAAESTESSDDGAGEASSASHAPSNEGDDDDTPGPEQGVPPPEGTGSRSEPSDEDADVASEPDSDQSAGGRTEGESTPPPGVDSQPEGTTPSGPPGDALGPGGPPDGGESASPGEPDDAREEADVMGAPAGEPSLEEFDGASFAAEERRRRLVVAGGGVAVALAVVAAGWVAVRQGIEIPGLTDAKPGASAPPDAAANEEPAGLPRTDVALKTDPEGAHVVLNGHLTSGRTPGSFPLVEGRENELYVYKKGFEPARRVVTGTDDASPEKVELTEIGSDSERVTVEVESTPSGAALRFDGRSVGRTPVSVEDVLVAAVHHVQLKKEGHFRHTGLFRPASGESYPYSADLVPRKGDSKYCRVVYDFVPRGTVVEVDGGALGTARFASRHDCGTYLDIRARRANYRDTNHVLSTRFPGTVRIATRLEKVERTPGRVSVEVPADVTVYIGSNEIGDGSVDELELPAGTHPAVFETPDRERFRFDLKVRPEKSTRYRFEIRSGEGHLERGDE
ncbi:MAG: protein kinase [Bradymonadaceae bacterium]